MVWKFLLVGLAAIAILSFFGCAGERVVIGPIH